VAASLLLPSRAHNNFDIFHHHHARVHLPSTSQPLPTAS
jgi:hypothetical protein